MQLTFRHSTSALVLGNTFYQLVGKIVSMSITIFGVMLITRIYGKAEYGNFNLMQNWAAIFFPILDFGINAIAVRELSTDQTKAGSILSSILFFRISIATVLFLLFWVVFPFFGYEGDLLFGLRIGMSILLVQSLYATSNIIFQFKHKYIYATWSLIFGYLVILAMLLVGTFARVNISILNFGYVIGGLVTFFFSLRYLRLLGFTYTFTEVSWDLLKKYLGYSLPIGLMIVFSQINFRADSILLSILPLPSKYGYSNQEALGVYGLAYKIFDVVLVLPTFFMNAVYPVFLEHLKTSKRKFVSSFKKSVVGLFGISLVLSLLVYLLAPVGILILGGYEFSASTEVLRLFSFGLFLYFMTQPFAWVLVALNKQKVLPVVYLLAAFLNVSLNYIFIPKYVFFASAIITHISELVILTLLMVFTYKAIKSHED